MTLTTRLPAVLNLPSRRDNEVSMPVKSEKAHIDSTADSFERVSISARGAPSWLKASAGFNAGLLPGTINVNDTAKAVGNMLQKQFSSIDGLAAEVDSIMQELDDLESPSQPAADSKERAAEFKAQLVTIKLKLISSARILSNIDLPGSSLGDVKESINDALNKIGSIADEVATIMQEIAALTPPGSPDDDE